MYLAADSKDKKVCSHSSEVPVDKMGDSPSFDSFQCSHSSGDEENMGVVACQLECLVCWLDHHSEVCLREAWASYLEWKSHKT